MSATLRALQEKKASLLFAELSARAADPHLKTFQMKKHSYYRYRVQVSAKRFRVMLQEYKFNYCVLKWTDSEFSKDSGFLDCS